MSSKSCFKVADVCSILLEVGFKSLLYFSFYFITFVLPGVFCLGCLFCCHMFQQIVYVSNKVRSTNKFPLNSKQSKNTLHTNMITVSHVESAVTTTTAEKMITMRSMTENQTEINMTCSLGFNIRLDDVVLISEKLVEVNSSATNKSITLLEESQLRTSIRSGSHTDIGPRRSNEDQHIVIDDVSKQLGDVYKWGLPSSFYAIFDGHGGPEAASYVKDRITRLFFEDSNLPQTQSEELLDELFLKELQECQCKAFLEADQALLAEEECIISDDCGTTALTVLILGRHLLIANVGDCRAVISRKGVAKQISHDHRPSNLQEKKRVEELGGHFADGYLNSELAVTRALGDRHMKSPIGSFSKSPLTAEPEMTELVLSNDDEFMIIGCDGIWDVMSNEEAVCLVRRQLIQHNDPERCARELIDQALRLHTSDNLTAIVVCFSSHIKAPQPWRPKFRRSVQ